MWKNEVKDPKLLLKSQSGKKLQKEQKCDSKRTYNL
jgi:hypothetical protein